jgi:hypothetical protein
MQGDINDIRSDIARLIALYEAEKQRADVLAGKLAESEEQARKYKEQITDLNLQIDNQRLMSAFLGEGNHDEAKARINGLIREIDKCIKLLEN